MKRRLALVAFRDAGEGPWIRPRGCETGILVRGLGVGERIIATADFGGSDQRTQVLDCDGTFGLPEGGWCRIRFDKDCGGKNGVCHTHVDLLVA